MITFFQSIPFIVKLVIGINLLITGYMWVGQPVVINAPFPEFINDVAGFSTGFLIAMNSNSVQQNTKEYEITLKHEYVHYIQQAYITPLGFSLYVMYHLSKNFIKYGFKPYFFLYYTDNYFENQAYELMYSENIKIPEYINVNLNLNWRNYYENTY